MLTNWESLTIKRAAIRWWVRMAFSGDRSLLHLSHIVDTINSATRQVRCSTDKAEYGYNGPNLRWFTPGSQIAITLI